MRGASEQGEVEVSVVADKQEIQERQEMGGSFQLKKLHYIVHLHPVAHC
jgi:hypothetical protein